MLTSTVCAVLSVAGLGIAALTAFRRRFLAATRIAAFALIPIGLVMTGVIDWITGLVFKPTVWAGFGVLALSALLFLVSRAAERRSMSRKERRAAAKAARSGAPGADLSAAVGPSAAYGANRTNPSPQQGVTQGRGAEIQPGARSGGRSDARSGDADDFSDIEAILKKHGI
ncbi:hypothetical protein [Streptomyces purpurogeneiscleroticus]|uniref:hypothetical protein n=1 Tax=Streptomyces purpurogeneiscleroticus TaxID=68259 RepID=UPI001CC013AD|nr:hypothetical protein [Streptomyces purpurogeneiscleroticus]MBZ4017362.1 hypothetical protein [Streptomyces purpurogeneiscleroticus]